MRRSRSVRSCLALLTLTLACHRSVGPRADPPDAAPELDGATLVDDPVNGDPLPLPYCPITLRLGQHDRAESDYDPNAGSACVEVLHPLHPPYVGAIDCVRLGAAYFGEPVKIEKDRCTDDGSTPEELRATCIGARGALVHVHARAEGGALVVSIDGHPDVRWRSVCMALGQYRFVVPEMIPSFEAIRASWGRREPSERCIGFTGPVRNVDVVLRVSMPPRRAGQDYGSICTHAKADLRIPSLGIQRDLGAFGNYCGAVSVYDLADVEGAEVYASDMGVSRRFAFPLGDRLVYLTGHDQTETLDLPCGARVHFRVDAQGEREGRARWTQGPAAFTRSFLQ